MCDTVFLKVEGAKLVWLLVAAAVLILIWLVILTYNRLIKLRMSCDEAFSGMDVYLRKRFDLIPNLAAAAKGYLSHEREILSEVTAARARVGESRTVSERIEHESGLDRALGRLIAVFENYPELKADQTILSLMEQLRQIEEDIARGRLYYNGVVRSYNVARSTFPAVLLANLFRFGSRPFYESGEDARSPVPLSLE